MGVPKIVIEEVIGKTEKLSSELRALLVPHESDERARMELEAREHAREICELLQEWPEP
jgi:hypothetical protein